MKYSYGTAGFRYKSDIIEAIAFRIGKGIMICSDLTNDTIGVMLTASHNPYKDNGVKIVDDKGNMINKDLEKIMEKVVNTNFHTRMEKYHTKIIFGMDTRPSCKIIKEKIIRGIKSVNRYVQIIDLGLCTTPQHHLYVYNSKINYVHKYAKILTKIVDNFNNPLTKVKIDCANGVGTITMAKILDQIDISNNKLNIELINTNVSNSEMLNNKCGSDYVMNNKHILNKDDYEKDVLYASFDGDGDRIIFYFLDSETNKFKILSGDYISALIVVYLEKQKMRYKNTSKGVVYTGYSNGGFIDYVSQYKINKACTPTGVKHLHHKAKDYDIGIYFENNGHGTCLINYTTNNILYKIFNQTVGDAIATLIGVLYMLNKTGLTIKEWHNLYYIKPCINKKMSVPDKSIYKTNKDQTKLLQPKIIAEKLEKIFKKYDIRGFIRPSGTENVVRLYMEFNKNKRKSFSKLNRIVDEIKQILI